MAAPSSAIAGKLVITGTPERRQRSMTGFAAAITLVSARIQKQSIPRARTTSAAETTSVTFAPFASTSSMPSAAHTSRPSFTDASAFGSAGFHTQPTRRAPGAAARRAPRRSSAGCSVPNPATCSGRVDPGVHGPSGTPIAGGDATSPNTCGTPERLARITAWVAGVESEITTSKGGDAPHACAAICPRVPTSPSALKRSITVPAVAV